MGPTSPQPPVAAPAAAEAPPTVAAAAPLANAPPGLSMGSFFAAASSVAAKQASVLIAAAQSRQAAPQPPAAAANAAAASPGSERGNDSGLKEPEWSGGAHSEGIFLASIGESHREEPSATPSGRGRGPPSSACSPLRAHSSGCFTIAAPKASHYPPRALAAMPDLGGPSLADSLCWRRDYGPCLKSLGLLRLARAASRGESMGLWGGPQAPPLLMLLQAPPWGAEPKQGRRRWHSPISKS